MTPKHNLMLGIEKCSGFLEIKKVTAPRVGGSGLRFGRGGRLRLWRNHSIKSSGRFPRPISRSLVPLALVSRTSDPGA